MKSRYFPALRCPAPSPPARGAWIEIDLYPACPKEGKSPPARGAWIEIQKVEWAINYIDSRPPHGGRGLKSHRGQLPHRCVRSPPARGAWIEISPLIIASAFSRVAPRTGGVD